MVRKKSMIWALIVWVFFLLAGLCTQPQTVGKQVVIQVRADGTGDYPTLLSAIEAAPPGAQIKLSAGTYVQTQPVVIAKPLELVGDGMDSTIIVGNTGEYVVMVSAAGNFSAHGIGFKYTGEDPADVMVVDVDTVEIVSCSFTGAVQTSGRVSWAGLRIVGDTKGVIKNCRATDNTGEGITVEGEAEVTVESCVCSHNAGCGIAFLGSAKGAIRGNLCEHNGQAGIGIAGQATPEVYDNVCNNNGSGIWVVHTAKPTLSGNTCERNDRAGIAYFAGAPFGYAAGNICRENTVGILVASLAHPTLEENECSDNSYGILVSEYAQVGLSKNRCFNNDHIGILFKGQAVGLVIRNECKANGEAGMEVREKAQPSLEANSCSENKGSGIILSGQFKGRAKGNVCRGNEAYGIKVTEEAEPTLEMNLCEENKGSGIAYFDTSAGRARNNVCRHNGMPGEDNIFVLLLSYLGWNHGIYVGDQAHPILEGNELEGNQFAGLAIGGTSKALVEGSTFSGNKYGIFGYQTASATLVGSTIKGNNDRGISLAEDATLFMSECEVIDNEGDGIFLCGNAEVQVQSSSVVANMLTGLRMEDSSEASVVKCQFSQNLHGVELIGSATLSVKESVFADNRYTGLDISGSSEASLEGSTLSFNMLGLRAGDEAHVYLENIIIENNSAGIAVENKAHVQLNNVVLRNNSGYAILMLDNAFLRMSGTTFVDNGQNDVFLGTRPYGLPTREPVEAQIEASNVSLQLPTEPPEEVKEAVDAIVEVWPSGFDEVTNQYWEFAANGVILSTGPILTTAHVFYGEDENNPNVWLKLTSLEIVDADQQVPILRLKDLKLGATEHGPHPAAMDHSRDLAVLYPKVPLPFGATVAKSVSYGELVWCVGYVGFLGTGEIWRFIPGFISIPPRDYIVAYRELFKSGDTSVFLPDLWIRGQTETVKGMSGSPVFTSAGELVGIAMRGKALGGIGVARAIDLPRLKPLEDSE